MGLRRWNVVRKDETTNGTFWRKVGTMVEFDNGDRKLNLFMFPQEFRVIEDSEERRTQRRDEKHEKQDRRSGQTGGGTQRV